MSSTTSTIPGQLTTGGTTDFSSLTALAPRVDAIGGGILRYGLVTILLYLGTFKFTAVEAQAIQPLVAHSPLMGWLYAVLSVQAVSNLIGAAEIAVALLLGLRPVSAKLAAIGSVGGILTFLATLSFLFSTPGVWDEVPGYPLPMLSSVGFFIFKDLFLLGASVWSLGEALRAMHKA